MNDQQATIDFLNWMTSGGQRFHFRQKQPPTSTVESAVLYRENEEVHGAEWERWADAYLSETMEVTPDSEQVQNLGLAALRLVGDRNGYPA